jgi:hypothetical protein
MSWVPHSPQNFLPSGSSVWHLVHFMADKSFILQKQDYQSKNKKATENNQ